MEVSADAPPPLPVGSVPRVGAASLAVPGLRRAGSFLLIALPQLAILAVVAWPWVRRDLQWTDVADAPGHLTRTYLMYHSLARGDLFPRWFADLNLGYGYPALNYYAPGLYYLGALLHRLGMTFYASFQWAGVIGTALGIGGAYALGTAITSGRRDAGLLAAVAYGLTPYAFFSNLYVRGALSEALGLGVLPWLLLAAWHTWYRGGGWSIALAALTAAFMLTHNISAMLGVGLLVAWLALLLLLRDRPEGTRAGPALLRTGAAIGLGLGLTSFFWLPALAEGRYVHLNLAQGDFYDPRHWLFDFSGATGAVAKDHYPHTHAGPADLSPIFSYQALGLGMPEKIGLGQLLIWLFPLLALPAGWLLSRRSRSGAEAARLGRLAVLMVFWAALAAACWFMNTTWSGPLWGTLPMLPLVQFPWRLYGILALCAALAAAAGMAALPAQGRAAWPGRALAVALAVLVAVNATGARPFKLGPEPPRDVDGGFVAGLEYNRFGAGTTGGGEFLPVTVHWDDDQSPNQKRGPRIYDDAYPQAGWQAGMVRVLNGQATITGAAQQPNRLIAQVAAEAPATLGFHQLLFPGWSAYVDGQPAALGAVEYSERARAYLGFMTVNVPPGTHLVELRFGPTRLRLLAQAISAAAVALVVAWPFGRWRRRGAGRRELAVAALVAALAAGVATEATELSLRPLRTPPAAGTWTVANVASAVAASAAETRSPTGTGRGALPPYLEVRYERIEGEDRRWLYMHPSSEAVVHLRVPPHAYLQAGLALDPQTWTTDVGDGVRFIVEAEGSFGRRTLLDRHVNPRAKSEERTWLDTWVSLESVAGQDVRLILRTDPAEDTNYDWAGWSNPQIVVWDQARPDPGAVHKW